MTIEFRAILSSPLCRLIGNIISLRNRQNIASDRLVVRCQADLWELLGGTQPRTDAEVGYIHNLRVVCDACVPPGNFTVAGPDPEYGRGHAGEFIGPTVNVQNDVQTDAHSLESPESPMTSE